MKKIIVILALALVFVGCKNELEFKTIKFYKKTTMPCKQGCPQVAVSVAFAEPKSEVSDSINFKIFATVQSLLYYEDTPKTFADYESLLTHFISQYEKIQTENPKDTFSWEADIKASKIYQSNEILNFEISYSSDTGGEHGNSGLLSIIVDPKTGKTVTNKALFIDESKFKVFAEKQFRSTFKINKKVSINATGFMFEDDKFQLPKNYFFKKNGLLLYYNHYEIASYAQGPQELLLSYDDVKPYLKFQ